MKTHFWQTNWFRAIIGTLISIAFLYLAINDVPLGDVAQALARANYFWVALGVAAIVAQAWLRAMRWMLLYYPLHTELRAGTLFGIMLVSQMLNIAAPWRIGEVARIYLAGESEKRSATQTLATLAVEKLFDFEMLLLILLGLPLFMTLPSELEQKREGLVVIVVALFAAVFLLVLFREGIVRLLARVRLRLFGKSLDAHAQMALLGLDVFKKWNVHLVLQVMSLIVWGIGGVVNYFVFLALDIRLPLFAAFLMLAITQVGLLVPSSPGKVGVFQYLCILGLAIFSIDKSTGLTYGILLYLVAFGPPVILGILALWRAGINLQRVAEAQ
jgi:hypothetical protein